MRRFDADNFIKQPYSIQEMLAAYCNLKNAQKVKTFLIKKGALDYNHLPIKELDHLLFPLNRRISVLGAKIINSKLKFKEKPSSVTIKTLLKGKLTKKEMNLIPRSQEVVGSIMILEVPEGLKTKEKLIAQAYLKLNKNIKTVVKKTKIHSGIFRLRRVAILAGVRTKETIHRENGIRIKLDLEKTYFSTRSANERLRVAGQIKKGENVLVMFSGAAPFPLVIAKNSSAKIVYGIELNLQAHIFAQESVKLNKMEKKIKLFCGDVNRKVPRLRKKFERIIMPLPKTGEEFLGTALKVAKKGTVIHLYAFLGDDEIKAYSKKVKEICNSFGRKVRILRKVKCGQFSPYVFRLCFDLRVLN